MANGRTDPVGEAVFVTQDGLVAEGSGLLSSIADHFSIVEFRDSHGNVDHLPPSGKLAFFGSLIAVADEPTLLLGVVTTVKDAMGRPGFFGAAIAAQTTNLSSKHYEQLMHLFSASFEYYKTTFRHTRHSETFGFLQSDTGSNHALHRLDPQTGFSIYARGNEKDELESVLLLWDLTATTGKTTMLWNLPEAPYETLTDIVVDDEMERLQKSEQAAEKAQEPADLVRSLVAKDAASYSATDKRSEIFKERTAYLKYPRPTEITPEFEDYFIGLIQFVNDQSVAPASNEPPDIDKDYDSRFEDARFMPHARYGTPLTGLLRNKLLAPVVAGVLIFLLLLIVVATFLFGGSDDGEDAGQAQQQLPTSIDAGEAGQ